MTSKKSPKCPNCGSAVTIGAQFFPFCSDRCKLIDLGAWAQEKYRTPVVESPTQEAEDSKQELEND